MFSDRYFFYDIGNSKKKEEEEPMKKIKNEKQKRTRKKWDSDKWMNKITQTKKSLQQFKCIESLQGFLPIPDSASSS